MDSGPGGVSVVHVAASQPTNVPLVSAVQDVLEAQALTLALLQYQYGYQAAQMLISNSSIDLPLVLLRHEDEGGEVGKKEEEESLDEER
jgi:hypothetical protein